jgi:hypothetical protein
MYCIELPNSSYGFLYNNMQGRYYVEKIRATGERISWDALPEKATQAILTNCGIVYAEDTDATYSKRFYFDGWDGRTNTWVLEGMDRMSIHPAICINKTLHLNLFYINELDQQITGMLALPLNGDSARLHVWGATADVSLLTWCQNLSGGLTVLIGSTSDTGRYSFLLDAFESDGEKISTVDPQFANAAVAIDEMEQSQDGGYHFWGTVAGERGYLAEWGLDIQGNLTEVRRLYVNNGRFVRFLNDEIYRVIISNDYSSADVALWGN